MNATEIRELICRRGRPAVRSWGRVHLLTLCDDEIVELYDLLRRPGADLSKVRASKYQIGLMALVVDAKKVRERRSKCAVKPTEQQGERQYLKLIHSAEQASDEAESWLGRNTRR